MSRFRTMMSQSPAIVISVIALTFSLGGGAGFAASVAAKAPAAPKISWHALSLRNSWKAAGKAFSTGNPEYTVSNNIVYLTGVADRANQSAPLGVIGVLPKSARPKHSLWFAAFNYAGAGESSIEVSPNGDVSVLGNGGDENFFTSLAGIEFPKGS
jgi:hypothetical protein